MQGAQQFFLFEQTLVNGFAGRGLAGSASAVGVQNVAKDVCERGHLNALGAFPAGAKAVGRDVVEQQEPSGEHVGRHADEGAA